MVLRDPAAEVLLIGPESDNESLRYELQFYSLAYLQRFNVSSDLLTRLYYALSRQGIEMRADCAALFVTDSVIRAGNDGPSAAPSRKRPLTPLPPSIPAVLAGSGLRLLFGPGEVIPSDIAGFVVAGSAREAITPNQMNLAARIKDLLARPAPSAGRYLIAEEELARISSQAAGYIGPIAYALAKRCARMESDPYLVYHALAKSIPDGDQRRRFLASGPACPMRQLGPSAPFGWAAMLGFEPAEAPCRFADGEAELLTISRSDLLALRNPDGQGVDTAALAAAIASEPGLAGVARASLIERLGGAGQPGTR